MKLLLLLLSLYFIENESLIICSFNVRSFGEAKSGKPEIMALIVKTVSRCDLMLLMEIKDNKDKAIHFLMDQLNSQAEMKDEFDLTISKRLGRNTYKEQYAFIYRKQLITVQETYQYHDLQDGDEDVFSREPFVVWFKAPKTGKKQSMSFGEAKSGKPEIMALIVKTVSRCDLMLLMEIKDNKDKAIHFLMDQLNSQAEMKDEFDLTISKRLGRNTYKEQYAFIYRKQLITVQETYQYHDLQDGDEDVFSREPFVVWFKAPKTEVKEFVVIPLHTTPEASVREIDELYDVFLDVKQKWKSKNFIFMGDFNAGCSYVPKKHWQKIRLRSNPEFVWLIGDKDDTTIKSTTKCAYDRIVVHGDKLVESIVPESAGVFNFMEEFGLTEVQALEVSDHFPVQLQIKNSISFVDKTKTFFQRIKAKLSVN